MELPCPHCGQMLQMGPPLQAHIAEQHAGAAEAAKEEERQEAARQEEKRRAAAAAAKDKPQKLNPPRRQVAAFAALKTAVAEANKEVRGRTADCCLLPPTNPAAPCLVHHLPPAHPSRR